MELQNLKVTARTGKGKGPAGRLRREGVVPLVLYGGDGETVSLSVDGKELSHLLHGKGGEHAVVQLEVEGKPEWNTPALVKDVQHHELRGHVLHADLLRIRLDEKIQTAVPINLVGRAKGIIDGGVIDHVLREVEIECLALDVPEFLEIDITELNIGESLKVEDLPGSEKFAFLTELDRAVVAIHAPRVAETKAEEGEEIEALEGEEGEGAGKEEGEKKED